MTTMKRSLRLIFIAAAFAWVSGGGGTVEASCVERGNPCTGPECCGTDKCFNEVCVACVGVSGDCSDTAQCCGALSCLSGACWDSCIPDDELCDSSVDCCSSDCVGNFCQNCSEESESCQSDDDCCNTWGSLVCIGPMFESGQCGECIAQFENGCYTDDDCCFGYECEGEPFQQGTCL
jgi:hypothetical protein